ncbi:olfactory receptor 5B2-like [Cervus canadensis]|uniref:olfactory receptor 5B2-like n=1 Tax=Cervus canadensis TaxID=1574408 RepID=UPI001C9E77C6|nr:olfactory receptor 5B2-like [Cervus canadensis]
MRKRCRSSGKVLPQENSTEVTDFILLGLTDDPQLQVPLFVIFTFIYLLTLIGNLGMTTLILLDSRLHTPMYFFLCNLSLVDFCYSSTITPKVMAGLLKADKVISYHACAAQMFFFIVFATAESYLLASMAYDQYAAVCKPLHYTTSMTTNRCACLVVGSYACGVLNASVNTGDKFSLSFCGSNVIHHFFCDVPAVMTLSCSEKRISEMILVLVSSFNVLLALSVILISYLFICMTVLRVHSQEGYQKALSTCASHLTTVSIFYGTVIFMYVQPSSSHSMDTDKITSVFYTMLIPMLNPVVYSLRNREVKSAFNKAAEKIRAPWLSAHTTLQSPGPLAVKASPHPGRQDVSSAPQTPSTQPLGERPQQRRSEPPLHRERPHSYRALDTALNERTSSVLRQRNQW